MGSLDHKNFGALQPQFWRARSATGAVYRLLAAIMTIIDHKSAVT